MRRSPPEHLLFSKGTHTKQLKYNANDNYFYYQLKFYL